MALIKVELNNFTGLKAHLNGKKVIDVSKLELIYATVTLGIHSIRYWNYNLGISNVPRILKTIKKDRLSGEYMKHDVYKNCESTFKKELSYLHGMVSAKLISMKVLGINKILHYQLYKDVYHVINPTRKEPDYIGYDNNGYWYVIEAKGTAEGKDTSTIAYGKVQAQSVSSIGGTVPTAVVTQSYFDDDLLNIVVEDPTPKENQSQVDIDYYKFDSYYYEQFYHYIISNKPKEFRHLGGNYLVSYDIETDITIGLNTKVLNFHPDKELSNSFESIERDNLYIGSDGIMISIGDLTKLKEEENK
jgi:hypothetical protein